MRVNAKGYNISGDSALPTANMVEKKAIVYLNDFIIVTFLNNNYNTNIQHSFEKVKWFHVKPLKGSLLNVKVNDTNIIHSFEIVKWFLSAIEGGW